MRHRVRRLSGGSRIVRWDTFTDIDGTSLAEHCPDDGSPWFSIDQASGGDDWPVINNGRVHNLDDALNRLTMKARWSRTRRSFKVSCDFVMRSDNEKLGAALVFRTVPYFYSGFQFRHVLTGTDTWQLFVAAPSLQSVQIGANVNQTLTVDQAYRGELEVRGPRIYCRVDGVIIIQGTSMVPLRCSPGLSCLGNATPTTGMHIDNWMVTR